MKESIFEVFINSFERYLVSGFLSCFFLISIGYYLSSYYSGLIPNHARNEEVFSISSSYQGEVDYDVSSIYQNDRYNTYHNLSQIFLLLPLYAGILIGLIQAGLKSRFETKLKNKEYAEGQEAVSVYKKSLEYINRKRNPFNNFCSGYYIALLIATLGSLNLLFVVLLSQ